jgi:hypothetical protein
MLRPLSIALALSVAACGFGNDVGQTGGYEIARGTRVTDSALYPLRSFLVVEQDARVKQLRVYCFTGDLRRADVGLEDLRRIALRFGGFAMAFDAPQERVQITEDSDAGVEDADAGPIAGHGAPLEARVGEQTLMLVKLDDKGLFRSGASRYLTAVRTSEYVVNAYVGVLDAQETVPKIAIESLGIEYASALESAQPGLVRTDALLGFSYVTRADYLMFELAQTQRRKADKSRVDALVRTLVQPGGSYALSPALLTNVAAQGCWSREGPIEGRVRQVARSYQQRFDGDWAVSFERIEVVSIPSEEWTALLGEPRPLGYCENFE